MQAIQTIYDDNHQIYGAPKDAKEMQKKGEKIFTKNCRCIYARNGYQSLLH